MDVPSITDQYSFPRSTESTRNTGKTSTELHIDLTSWVNHINGIVSKKVIQINGRFWSQTISYKIGVFTFTTINNSLLPVSVTNAVSVLPLLSLIEYKKVCITKPGNTSLSDKVVHLIESTVISDAANNGVSTSHCYPSHSGAYQFVFSTSVATVATRQRPHRLNIKIQPNRKSKFTSLTKIGKWGKSGIAPSVIVYEEADYLADLSN